MIGDGFTSWSRALKEIRLLPSQRDWETGKPSLITTFQRDGYQVLERHAWVVKLTRDF